MREAKRNCPRYSPRTMLGLTASRKGAFLMKGTFLITHASAHKMMHAFSIFSGYSRWCWCKVQSSVLSRHLQHSGFPEQIISQSPWSSITAVPQLGLAYWVRAPEPGVSQSLFCYIVKISRATQSKRCVLLVCVTVSSFPCSPKQIHLWETHPRHSSCEPLSEDSPVSAQCFQTWSLSGIQQSGEILCRSWTVFRDICA